MYKINIKSKSSTLGMYGKWRILNFGLNDIKRARSEAIEVLLINSMSKLLLTFHIN